MDSGFQDLSARTRAPTRLRAGGGTCALGSPRAPTYNLKSPGGEINICPQLIWPQNEPELLEAYV